MKQPVSIMWVVVVLAFGVGGLVGMSVKSYRNITHTDGVCRSYFIHAAAVDGEPQKAECDNELHTMTLHNGGWIECNCKR